MKGKIIKGIGGFYYVHVPDKDIYECRAKGVFRNNNIKPLVGDDVIIDEISITPPVGNIISVIKPRNKLIRPAVANIDQAVIIFSLQNPSPNYNLLDRFLFYMDNNNIKTVIVFNKTDLVSDYDSNEIKEIYTRCGYDTILISALSKKTTSELDQIINNKTTVFAGPSGVGKSSILNIIRPGDLVEVGEISKKIKRGKHTTRHSELYKINETTYIMDTPGFSSLDIKINDEKMLKSHYQEFETIKDNCKYSSCNHVNEPDCAVKRAVESGEISKLRYNNYLQIFNEIKDNKKW